MHRILPQVERATVERAAVVALESTLIAQGLPWPDNLETARASERAVVAAGAVPATIAIHQGVVRIGLTDAELVEVAHAKHYHKAGRRDLAAALALRRDAATTVSATLALATRFGIDVMATGGLGGVHRGAERTFDVSNDLDELARADGALVVCSGVKSILDIAATLESLETRGVTVVGYRTDVFPAFTTVSSGIPLDTTVDNPDDAAEIVRAHRALRLPGAIVLAQPPPAELALDRDEMERALARASVEAEAAGIVGKAVTPFLLAAIREETEGRSLIANRALIVANAGLAAEVAVRLADRR